MTNNLKNILDNSINFVLMKNIESSSIIISLKSVLKVDKEGEIKQQIATTKLDFKAVENMLINNQFINDIISKVKESYSNDLNNLDENLKNLIDNKYIFQAIESTKHNDYFLKDITINKNVATGNIDIKSVAKILENNLLSEDKKNQIIVNIESNEIKEESENKDKISGSNQENSYYNKINDKKIINGFESTIKWVIVGGVVIGLFIIIFLIIKKNNNKMNNLAELNTKIKYVSNLSDDSLTSSIVDLGTEL